MCQKFNIINYHTYRIITFVFEKNKRLRLPIMYNRENRSVIFPLFLPPPFFLFSVDGGRLVRRATSRTARVPGGPVTGVAVLLGVRTARGPGRRGTSRDKTTRRGSRRNSRSTHFEVRRSRRRILRTTITNHERNVAER